MQSAVSPEGHGVTAISRRSLLSSAAGIPLAVSMRSEAAKGEEAMPSPGGAVPVTLKINGKSFALSLDSRTTLLDALRDHAGLTGSKKGCDHGQCGACTVLVADRRILSCLTLAVSVRQPVTTIEGLSHGEGNLHPMQQAFLDKDAFQCGYCTPGQIMSAIACVNEGHAGSDAEIQEYMSGNLCRCAAYPHITEAINQAKTQMGKG